MAIATHSISGARLEDVCPHDKRPVVAFGPNTGWGSWDWVGADLIRALSRDYRTVAWRDAPPADSDVVVAIKFLPPCETLVPSKDSPSVIYCPIDRYGSAAEIDAETVQLRRCSRIVVHCPRLRRYFEPYAPVEEMDHHVKFTSALPTKRRTTGDILWVGIRANISPLVTWVNEHSLPAPLYVLTDADEAGALPSPAELGFRADREVRVELWSDERHRKLVSQARCAIDIKGTDFRQLHKPPAKAIDFIASGLPLAMNAQSSSVEYLARLGFQVCAPEDERRWLSADYWRETVRFGRALGELLRLERIAARIRLIVNAVLLERATMWRGSMDRVNRNGHLQPD